MTFTHLNHQNNSYNQYSKYIRQLPESLPEFDSQNESPWLKTLSGEQREMAEAMLKTGMTKGEIEKEFAKRGWQKE